MATLTVRDLTRSYEAGRRVVDGVSFEVADGRVAALLGPSGSGKTTILRLIAGLDRPEGGDVLLDGASVLDRAPHRRGVGLLFQELALFPHLDVRANVEFGLRMAKWPRARREQRATELLELVGLSALASRRVDALSSGERQRVGLARALAPEPDVLLLDEPLGALDEARKRELRRELHGLLDRLGTTALIVSHDLRDAQALADDLIVMDAGRVLQFGPLRDVLSQPVTAFVAAMVGWVRLIDGPLVDGRVSEDGVGAIELPPPPPPRRRVGAAARRARADHGAPLNAARRPARPRARLGRARHGDRDAARRPAARAGGRARASERPGHPLCPRALGVEPRAPRPGRGHRDRRPAGHAAFLRLVTAIGEARALARTAGATVRCPRGSMSLTDRLLRRDPETRALRALARGVERLPAAHTRPRWTRPSVAPSGRRRRGSSASRRATASGPRRPRWW